MIENIILRIKGLVPTIPILLRSQNLWPKTSFMLQLRIGTDEQTEKARERRDYLRQCNSW